MSSGDPRMHVRLRYPVNGRPTLILEDAALDVIDLSERGLRFRQEHGPEPKVGERLEGILRTSRGETVPVRGRVVRVSRIQSSAPPGTVEVAAHLTELGIPPRVIMAERHAIQGAQQG
jgi:PilZ domain-containing protein